MADLTSNQVCNICCIHYNAGLRCCALGSLVEGGYLFAKRGGIGWIVACSSREVGRSWYCREDAVTVAQASNACGDWYIPSRTDLQLSHGCKSFWDSYSTGYYWSSTEYNNYCGFDVYFQQGHVLDSCKSDIDQVRAFRRVSY